MSEPAIAASEAPDEADERLAERLERTWGPRGGFVGFLSAVDHLSLGKRFIATAFLFFLLGGALAFVMRLQLAFPERHLVGPDLYDQIFTMHGSTMMFLFAVPVMEAFGLYLVPLLVGARSIAFPRLVAFSYWIFAFGGVFLFAFFFANVGPDTGWFAYVPLSGPGYAAGKRVDVWSQLINFTELSALALSTALITTILKLRAPGMSLARMPVFTWATLVTSWMVLFAMPAVMMGSLFLTLDRLVGTHFYNPAEAGDVILWQHLFWFFGHPEVYIIFIPALGMVSEIVETFARRPLFGYTAVVLSMVATGFLGFGLWVHHMFATGLPEMGQGFFTAASLMIAIPTGVQFFCWTATLWGSGARVATPLLYVLGFYGIFLIGGFTGVMLGSVPLDLQVHDTFFVVAHLHYVLIGGSVFPLFGAVHFWFPKMTGRLLSEKLGTVAFWLLFVGFNVTFFPMHILGLRGMPRRVYTYLPETGWGPLNLLATMGALVLATGVLVFVVNVVVSRRRGVVAGDNPWGGTTLEWATASPPPSYGFLHVPVVAGRMPLAAGLGKANGIRADVPEVLVTTAVDAVPEARLELAGPSIWPFVVACVVTAAFVAAIFTPWALPIGSVGLFLGMVGWAWPRRRAEPEP